MNIYQLIKQEHGLVDDLIAELQSSSGGSGRADLMRELELALVSHAYAETETLYRVLAGESELRAWVAEGEDEHMMVESLLGECQEVIEDDELFLQKLEQLQMAVQEHVQDEENDILPRAQRILDDVVAEALLGEFMATKEEVRTSMMGGRGRPVVPAVEAGAAR